MLATAKLVEFFSGETQIQEETNSFYLQDSHVIKLTLNTGIYILRYLLLPMSLREGSFQRIVACKKTLIAS